MWIDVIKEKKRKKGKKIQAEETASAKGLRQKHAWRVRGITKRASVADTE